MAKEGPSSDLKPDIKCFFLKEQPVGDLLLPKHEPLSLASDVENEETKTWFSSDVKPELELFQSKQESFLSTSDETHVTNCVLPEQKPKLENIFKFPSVKSEHVLLDASDVVYTNSGDEASYINELRPNVYDHEGEQIGGRSELESNISPAKQHATIATCNTSAEQHATVATCNTLADQFATVATPNSPAEQHTTVVTANSPAKKHTTIATPNSHAEQHTTIATPNSPAKQHTTIATRNAPAGYEMEQLGEPECMNNQHHKSVSQRTLRYTESEGRASSHFNNETLASLEACPLTTETGCSNIVQTGVPTVTTTIGDRVSTLNDCSESDAGRKRKKKICDLGNEPCTEKEDIGACSGVSLGLTIVCNENRSRDKLQRNESTPEGRHNELDPAGSGSKSDPRQQRRSYRIQNLQKNKVNEGNLTGFNAPPSAPTATKAHAPKPTKERKFHCEDCNKSFHHKCYLLVHFRSHLGDKPYTCDICNKQFTQKNQVQMHLKMHLDHHKTQYVCTICNKTYLWKYSFISHMSQHTGNSLHHCSLCGQNFITKGTLNRHKRRHARHKANVDKPHQCLVCAKKFACPWNLKSHSRTHLMENLHLKTPGQQKSLLENVFYRCDVCGKYYAHRNSFLVHKKRHLGIKSFVCGDCGKAFFRNGDLKVHKRTHSGEKPYSCDLCGRCYADKSSLRAHVRRHLKKKRVS